VAKECKLPRVEISCTQAVVVKIIIAKKVMSKDHVYAAEEHKKNFISCVREGEGKGRGVKDVNRRNGLFSGCEEAET
jgi:hypothetical protein